MGLGRNDGRRSYQPKLISNLGSLPFSQAQKAVLDAKAFAIQSAPPFLHPNLNFFNPPADANYFTVTPNPFPKYPAVGGGPLTVISFSVPPSKVACVRKMAIVHFGGNPPDGTGIVVWRVLQNGAGLRGLGTLTAQYGTFANPIEASIFAYENDTLSVTVECPALLPDGVTPNPGPPGGSTTAARFQGFFYPLSEATSPVQGSY
jgi:hypothetical protein